MFQRLKDHKLDAIIPESTWMMAEIQSNRTLNWTLKHALSTNSLTHYFYFSTGLSGSSSAPLLLHANDAAKAFAFKHEVKGLVDLRERDLVSDELLHFKLLEHSRLGNQLPDKTKEHRNKLTLSIAIVRVCFTLLIYFSTMEGMSERGL